MERARGRRRAGRPPWRPPAAGRLSGVHRRRRMPRRARGARRARRAAAGRALPRHPDARDRRLRGHPAEDAGADAGGRVPHRVRPVRDSCVRRRSARLPGEAGERSALRGDDQAAGEAAGVGGRRRRARARRSSSRRRAARGCCRSGRSTGSRPPTTTRGSGWAAAATCCASRSGNWSGASGRTASRAPIGRPWSGSRACARCTTSEAGELVAVLACGARSRSRAGGGPRSPPPCDRSRGDAGRACDVLAGPCRFYRTLQAAPNSFPGLPGTGSPILPSPCAL